MEELKFEKGTLTDIYKIKEFIFEGAENGHFAADYLKKEAEAGLTYQLLNTIQNNIMPLADGNVKSEIYVLKKNFDLIGFTWIRYHDANNCESYLFYVDINERKQGYGKYMFNKSMSKISVKKIYVDLFEISQTMKNMLIKYGFTKEGENYSNADRFSYKQ